MPDRARIGYADPPYPGCAHLYRDHPDYAGEVDHAALIRRLEDEFDGWVLHTAATPLALALIAPLVEKTGARWMAWTKPFAAFKRNVSVAYAWEPVIVKAGGKPVSKVTPKGIAKGLTEREHTPSQARNYLDAVRGLFGWAVASGLAAADPTVGIKPPKRPKTDGFAAWSEDDVAAYRARWPRGTKERVWLAVVLATGLRRGDAVTLGKQHVRDGMLMLRTAKTGTAVYVPIFADLAEAIEDGPVGDLTFIVGVNGRALTKETFGNRFRMACDAAGLRGKSAHGLRKLAATRAAETGLTEAELESLFGWHGGKMASHYTKSADRRRLAERAAEKIRNAESPHPISKAPHLRNN